MPKYADEDIPLCSSCSSRYQGSEHGPAQCANPVHQAWAALVGPYLAVINVPTCAPDDTSDYDAERCLMIGKNGRDIPEEDALDYVSGYTASNDLSARSLQLVTMQWSFTKGFD